jgi:hypothetical protein
MCRDFGAWITLAEHFTSDVDPRKDASRLRKDDGSCPPIAVYGSGRRDIAAADVLGERAANQITVGVGG